MAHVICNDISGGQERRPIPVFNEEDDEKLPADFRSVRSPTFEPYSSIT